MGEGPGGTDYDSIWDSYEADLIDKYTEHDPPFPSVFDQYRDVPAAAVMLDDEPQHWDILRNKVLVDMYREHDADKILFNHLEDRTVTGIFFGVEGIDNYYSFVTCHEGLKILCGLTHHMKNATYANSSNLYNGLYAPTGEYQHGFPSMEARLSRARETSLYYDIPYWYVPSADYMRLSGHDPTEAGVKRWKSPREVRANVNMALTYGARGIMYLAIYDPRLGTDDYGEIAGTIFDNEGNLKVGDYDLVTYWKQKEELPNEMDWYETPITYEGLYDELIAINTKLDTVRNVLNTTISLDAFHSFDLANSLPRGLILDYEGNRTGHQYYLPKTNEETDFLDLGTLVCPYTGVRYFAVSDRFCNWSPTDFPNPTEHDVVTVRHPGRSVTDVYYDLDDMPYNDIYIPVEGWDHDSGVSEFEFELDNADGRILKLDPCLTLAPGFEYVENPDNVWDFDGGYAWVPGIDDEVSRKGNNSLKLDKRETGGIWTVTNEARLNIAGAGVGPFDVTPGATYRASGYIKAAPGWNGSAKIQVVWYNQNDWVIDLLAETPSVRAGTDWAGPGGWVYNSVDFKIEDIPPAAVKVGLNLALVGGTGNVWFDEVRLEPMSRIFNGHFEWDGGDWWPGQAFGWGTPMDSPGQKYWRVSPGYESDYCLKVGAKDLVENVVRNDEKLYLGKGTDYAVTGWAKRGLTSPGVDGKAVVEFYTNKDVKFKTKSYVVPTGGNWHYFTILIKPEDWEVPNPGDGTPGYVKIGCKMEAGSGDALFDDIELNETNRVANGDFELAEEGPHWPDRWDYTLVPFVPPGDPAWSALYDASVKYDRRCWRVRHPSGDIKYNSETFILDPSTLYRLDGWIRNFDLPGGNPNPAGCKLSITLYDGSGNAVGSYSTAKVNNSEEWTYKYVDFTTPGVEEKYYGRATVIEEIGACSSAADGIRVFRPSL